MVSRMAMAPTAATSLSSAAVAPSPSTKPLKPLLRRATLSGTVRSRDDAGLDIDDDMGSTPPSPSKRARTVTFNPTVDEKVFVSSPAVSEYGDMEDVRFDVRRALEEHIGGHSEVAYDQLKELFAPEKKRGSTEEDDTKEKNERRKASLLALTSCTSMLGKSCSGLIQVLLEMDWVGRDEGFMKVYVKFLGNFASAQGGYVGSVLGMLVDKFVRIKSSSGRLSQFPVLTLEQLFSRVHFALKYLLRLIPSASRTLAPILSSKFPFPDETKRIHMTYVNNMTRMTEYAPELKSEIYALITERLVKIDVQMQVDLDDMDDEVTASIVQALSLRTNRKENSTRDEYDDSDTESVMSDDSLDEDAIRVKEVQGNIEKMDAMLDALFSIYTPYFNDPDSVMAQSMFDTLLSHFRNIILPTYRSRHTQFLLFHFAQSSEHLVDTFAGECVDLAFKPGRPSILKQSAAAYLASFVSRGARVPQNVVRDVFDYIGANLDIIRAENEVSCRGPDLQRYGTFYATTQALLYIFCFRWRDLVVSPSPTDDDEIDDEDIIGRDLEWRSGVKELLDRTIYSKLNPLKICAPSIVEEFAKIASHLRFMFVYPLLEKNKRIRLSQFRSGGSIRETGFGVGGQAVEEGEEESWHQLDAYFPFDPYQLPVSRRWVEGDYVVWRGMPGLRPNEDDGSSTDGGAELDEEEDEEVEVDTATDDDED